jgi:hypothetical protein
MAEQTTFKPISKSQRIIAILWPSFLLSGVANSIFFTLFDPLELALLTAQDFTRTGAYSIGFFSFWLLTAASSALTQYFQRPSELVNRPDATT